MSQPVNSHKIVLLGNTGFIGSALCDSLKRSNLVPVQAFHSSTMNLCLPQSRRQLLEVMDSETILIVAARSRLTSDKFQKFSDDITIHSNIAACLSEHQIKKCLYLSSTSVYGDSVTNLSITENTAPVPLSLYGLSKFTGEQLLHQGAGKSNTNLFILRPCMIYGPGNGELPYGPNQFIESVIRNGKIDKFGDGKDRRDYLFIRDLVEIIKRFVFEDHEPGVYNVAAGQNFSFEEMITQIRSIARQAFEVITLDRRQPRVTLKINATKLLVTLPDFQFTNFELGLRETYNYFNNNNLLSNFSEVRLQS